MTKNQAFFTIFFISKLRKILSKMIKSISLLFKKNFPYLSNMKNIKTNLNIGLGQVLSSPFLSLAPDQYLNHSFKKLEELHDWY